MMRAIGVLYNSAFRIPHLWRAFGRIVLAGFLLLAAASCHRETRQPALGEVYVSSTSANVRDRLGAAPITVTTVKAGERLELLQKRRRWLRVRTPSGREGWLEERHVVTREVYDRFQQLSRGTAVRSSQGQAQARREVNLRLQPDRQAPAFYQIQEGEKCEVVGRRVTERAEGNAPLKPEDWYLVRSKGKAGWGLARQFEMTVPDEVLQHAEGKRVTAWFVLNTVVLDKAPPGQEQKPQILWATADREGESYDFDSFRVFVWSHRHRRYETARIERNLKGFYPILVWRERTAQGDFPAFSITTQNKQGEKQTRRFLLRETFVKRLS